MMRRLMACVLLACAPATEVVSDVPDPPTEQSECVRLTSGGGTWDMTVAGEAVLQTGEPWTDGMQFELIDAAVWSSAIPNGEGFYTSVWSTDGLFEFDGVPPGSYVARGSAGTCNGGCELSGVLGDHLDVEIEIYCNW